MQTTLESELQALAWSGEDDQWVWAITTGTTGMMVSSARHVYWSQDHGETMVDKFPTMAKMVDERMGADSERLASVNEVLVNKDDPKKVLLWGDGNLSFISTDGGNTLKLVDVPAGTLGLSHKIRPHPTQADWLLSIAYREICYISGTYGCAMDLWLSNDFGLSWKNLTAATGGKLAGAHALRRSAVQTTAQCNTAGSLVQNLWRSTAAMHVALSCIRRACSKTEQCCITKRQGTHSAKRPLCPQASSTATGATMTVRRSTQSCFKRRPSWPRRM